MGVQASSHSSSSSAGHAATTSNSMPQSAMQQSEKRPTALEPIFNFAGSETANLLSRELEFYAIRLEPYQSLQLYGWSAPKKTLTWRDVVDHSKITLRNCIQCNIQINKLHRLQPDIKEWIQHGKATARDCEYMGPWKPNPFTDLGCSIGDLVLYRRFLPASLLIESGLDFCTLRDRYGLTVDIMTLLHYSVQEWVDLQIEDTFLQQLTEEQWTRLFGLVSRNDIISRVRAQRAQKATLDSAFFDSS